MTFTSGPFANLTAKSAIFTANITAVTGTSATLMLTFQGVNHDGVAYTLLSSNPITQANMITSSPFIFVIGLGVTVTAGFQQAYPFPARWQVLHTIGGTLPVITYSLDIDLA